MKALVALAQELILEQHFDSLAYAWINFDTQKFESFGVTISGGAKVTRVVSPLYFDLASLTKPLTLSAIFHREPKLFSDREHLLLNHRGGVPAWGRLSRFGWREELLGLPVASSETLYSDYSALRLMLELEKTSGKSLKELCDFYWDEELCHWKDVPLTASCAVTGYRRGKLILREVNDPNAWNLGVFCSHAGLFATVDGLARSLFSLDRKTGFVAKMQEAFDTFDRKRRFLHGWDTAEENGLAGKGCGNKTFGHLGFTGTSIWIDSESRRGQVILTNGCHPWQQDRGGLSDLRRKLGEAGWKF